MSELSDDHHLHPPHRPQPRLWIEGKHLQAAGLAHGTRCALVQTDTGLMLRADPYGLRRVAGKPERPIIDITGTSLGAVGRAETVTCEYEAGGGLLTVTTQ
ncbi:hypothetical protein [Ruegeria atlantica]|uniref:hypothetical protein n=1 Tax=Ruegeria atlantica TaxID=81569 RepID=UPI00071E2A21|nr:hypothetical protein [Ruegeria atlantica]